MWYQETFSLTPFEERYKKVPFEWQEFCFLRYMNNPGAEDVRYVYLKKEYEKAKDKEKEEELQKQEQQLKELGGYDPEKVASIMKALKEVGK